MPEVNLTAVILDRHGRPVRYKRHDGVETDLFLRDLIADVLDLPPNMFGGGSSLGNAAANQVARFRSEIIEATARKTPTVFFDPKQVDEIVFCLSCVQPASIVRQAERLLEGIKEQAPAESNGDKTLTEAVVEAIDKAPF